MTQGKDILSFETTDQIPHQRGTKWTIGLVIAVLLGVLLSIWQESLSLGMVSLMIGIVYFQIKNKPPKKISVHISEDGIQINNDWYSYGECKQFWIIWKPFEVCMFHLELNKNRGEIHFPIDPTIRNSLKTILKNYIDENQNASERKRDIIARILKL